MGNCGACWYWREHMEDIGDCSSADVEQQASILRTHKDFGCIHFWNKEEAIKELSNKLMEPPQMTLLLLACIFSGWIISRPIVRTLGA